ncbi:MAG TPA: ChaN family lipoprotein [Terriglobia bacterium]|nr:ChaN family lipoprotein [Terriglobia bacterium]
MTSVILLSLAALFLVQDPKPPAIGEQHYRTYRGDGSVATLDQLVAESRAAAVTFLGESHDDPVAHYLEEQILRRTWDPDAALSLEMFERDVQYVLDEYLAGFITENHLVASGRAWKNYASDYRALIEFAKEKKMPVLAANAPRRYVDRVSRLGAASLAEIEPEGRRFLPPLPYAEASADYAAKFARVMEEHREEGKPPSPESRARSLEAQSLWDAAMAYWIGDFLTKHPGKRVLHVNGSFHTAQRLGIVEHLLRYRPNTSVVVVTILPEASFPAFDVKGMYGAGTFVVVTDPTLPRTYRSESSGPQKRDDKQ